MSINSKTPTITTPKSLSIYQLAKLTIRNKQQLKKQLLQIPWKINKNYHQVDISTRFLDDFLKQPTDQITLYRVNEQQSLGKASVVNHFLYSSKIPQTIERTHAISPTLLTKHKNNLNESIIDVSKNLSKIQFNHHKDDSNKQYTEQQDYQLLKQLNQPINFKYQSEQFNNQKLFKFLTKNSQKQTQNDIKQTAKSNKKDLNTKLQHKNNNDIQQQKQWSLPSNHPSSENIGQKISNNSNEDNSSHSIGQPNKLHQLIMNTQKLSQKRQKIKLNKTKTQIQQIEELMPFKKTFTQNQQIQPKEVQKKNIQPLFKTIKIDLTNIGLQQNHEPIKEQKSKLKKQIVIDLNPNNEVSKQESRKSDSYINLSKYQNFQISLNAISVSKFKNYNSKDQIQDQYSQHLQDNQQLLEDNFKNYESSLDIEQKRNKSLAAVIEQNYQESVKDQESEEQLEVIKKQKKKLDDKEKLNLEKQFMSDDLSQIQPSHENKISQFNQTVLSKKQKDELKLINQDVKSDIQSLKDKMISEMNISLSELNSKGKIRSSKITQKQQKSQSNDMMNIFQQMNQNLKYEQFRNDIDKLKNKIIKDTSNFE